MDLCMDSYWDLCIDHLSQIQRNIVLEISWVEGNLEGGGDGFPNTSRVLVEYGQSLSINFSTGSGSENPSLWAGKD